jgi:hypothetical protein
VNRAPTEGERCRYGAVGDGLVIMGAGVVSVGVGVGVLGLGVGESVATNGSSLSPLPEVHPASITRSAAAAAAPAAFLTVFIRSPS